MKNTTQNAYIYKLAFKAGLDLCGFADGRPQFIGGQKEYERYDYFLEKYYLGY